MSTTKYVLDRQHFESEALPDSVCADDCMADGAPLRDTAFSVIADAFTDRSFMVRVCRRLRSAPGCLVRIVGLDAVRQARLVVAPSAAAGTIRPRPDEPLLKADNYSPWATSVMSHALSPAKPTPPHLVLSGPPGCGKSLMVERLLLQAQQRALPHLFVSAADDDDNDQLRLVAQFFHTTRSRDDALFVIDDVDAFSTHRRAAAMMALIAGAGCRCLLVCNDAYGPHVRLLRRDKTKFRFVVATAVTSGALVGHLASKFPSLSAAQRAVIAEQSRGDVRAAQLAAELETLVERAYPPSAADDQRCGALHTDLERAVRAGASQGRAAHLPSVVEQCARLLRSRAVAAAEIMGHNYAHLTGVNDFDTLAAVADDLSGAEMYREQIADAEMAYKFARVAPDDLGAQENFRDELLFDVAVVLPCVRIASANAARQTAPPELVFANYKHMAVMSRTASMCRAADTRHEVLVRRTLALGGDEERGQLIASTVLSIARLHDAPARLAPKTGDAAIDSGGDGGGDGGDDDRPARVTATIDLLERTLYVFPLLCGPVNLRVPGERKQAIARLAAYGFDSDLYVRAIEVYAPQLGTTHECGTHFELAKALALDAGGDVVGAAPGGGGARKPTTAGKRGAAATAAGKKAKVDESRAPTALDRWIGGVRRAKCGDV